MYIEGDSVAFVEYANYVGKAGLVVASSGNMSCRSIKDNEILIKETGRWMENMEEEGVVHCDVNGKRLYPEFEGEPSIEWRFHVGILKARTDVNVVLHFQSPYATALSFTKGYYPIITPELAKYCTTIREVDYFAPGSTELANAIVEAQKDLPDIIIMYQHGTIATGAHFRDAVQKALFYEFACKTTYLSRPSYVIPSWSSGSKTGMTT